MAFIHQMQLLFTDCGFPRWSVCFTLPNAIFFYFLFNDFYQKSYKKKRAAAAKIAAEEQLDNNNDPTAKDHNKITTAFETKKVL